MQVFGLVFEDNPRELCMADGSNGLFSDENGANRFRDDWNRDIGMCESRVVIVVPLEIKEPGKEADERLLHKLAASL